MAETWFLLQSGRGASGYNMALDEALLTAAPRLGSPVLRFYGWLEPAATFGYSQRWTEVEAMISLRPLVRRTTGGGLVPHDRDWTYSVVVPPTHPWYAIPAKESYQRMHGWLQRSFAKAGLGTELSPCCQPEGPGRCFVGAEQFDLLWQGVKIAGAAQRRSRSGLLIQGSVQPPPVPLDREAWETAVTAVATHDWQVNWGEFAPDADLVADTARLTREKYGLTAHNQRR